MCLYFTLPVKTFVGLLFVSNQIFYSRVRIFRVGNRRILFFMFLLRLNKFQSLSMRSYSANFDASKLLRIVEPIFLNSLHIDPIKLNFWPVLAEIFSFGCWFSHNRAVLEFKESFNFMHLFTMKYRLRKSLE